MKTGALGLYLIQLGNVLFYNFVKTTKEAQFALDHADVEAIKGWKYESEGSWLSVTRH